MKKVVRLTESDLVRIVKKVIREQAPMDVYNPNDVRQVKPQMDEFDWKSHFDQIKNQLDSYLSTIEGPVDVKRFQNKVMNTYYQMVSNVDNEYSYPSHGEDFQQLTTDFMSHFSKKLRELVQNYGKLTESDLVRIIQKVISEQSMAPKKMEGRNNPSWIKLVSTLKNLPYPPKVLTFNSYDNPPIPSQSLNWGTAKGPNGAYAFAIASTDSEMPKERMILFDSKDRNKQMEMHKWWKQKGYQTDGNDISIRFDDADRLKSDILSFFKLYPPIK